MNLNQNDEKRVRAERRRVDVVTHDMTCVGSLLPPTTAFISGTCLESLDYIVSADGFEDSGIDLGNGGDEKW